MNLHQVSLESTTARNHICCDGKITIRHGRLRRLSVSSDICLSIFKSSHHAVKGMKAVVAKAGENANLPHAGF